MKTKIKVKDKVYELTDMCRWEIRDGVLWNLNTNHDEGVDGDFITYDCGNGAIKTGTVEGYTCYQFVSTKEHGKVILSADTDEVENDGLIHIA